MSTRRLYDALTGSNHINQNVNAFNYQMDPAKYALPGLFSPTCQTLQGRNPVVRNCLAYHGLVDIESELRRGRR